MNEIRQLKQAFIEFIEKLLPTIPDPMFIIGQRWQIFKNLLENPSKSVTDIVAYVSNLNIGNVKKQVSQHQRKLSCGDEETNNMNQEIFQPETYFKLNLPNKNLFVKQSSQRKIIDKQERKKSPQIIDSIKQNSVPETLKLDLQQINKSPKIPSKFQIFFSLPQNQKYSSILKDCLHEDVQSCINEFQKHTNTMICIEQRSFEINTGELNETDRKMKGENYGFGAYVQHHNQKGQQKSFKHISVFEQKKIDQNM